MPALFSYTECATLATSGLVSYREIDTPWRSFCQNFLQSEPRPKWTPHLYQQRLCGNRAMHTGLLIEISGVGLSRRDWNAGLLPVPFLAYTVDGKIQPLTVCVLLPVAVPIHAAGQFTEGRRTIVRDWLQAVFAGRAASSVYTNDDFTFAYPCKPSGGAVCAFRDDKLFPTLAALVKIAKSRRPKQ